MPLTQNQIDTVFQDKLKRPSTPFEYGTYKNSSVQDLGSIDTTYGKLNKDNSITDYLRYTGADPSMANRQVLAQQNGIQNYGGSAESNTALLNSLRKQNQAPQSDISDPSLAKTGTLNTPTPQPDASQTIDQGTIPNNPNNPSLSTAGQSIQPTPLGDYQAPSVNPAVATTLSNYQNIQSQIGDIDSALANELSQKKKQVIASGGIVNEAELMGEVRAERAPLLEQRASLAKEQSTVGRQYQQLLGSDKANQANSIKEYQLKQKSFDDAQKQYQFAQTEADKTKTLSFNEAKFGITEADKKALADTKAWKIQKINVYDDNRTKSGEKLVAVNATTGQQRPVTTAQALSAGQSIPANVGNSTIAKSKSSGVSSFSFQDFYSNSEAPLKEVGSKIDSRTGLSANAIYEQALNYVATNKLPSIGNGTKPRPTAIRTAIINKSAAMLSAAGITQPQYAQLYKANGSAISKVTDRLARIETVNQTLSAEFPTLKSLADQVNMKSITESDLSAGKASINAKFGSTPAARYIELVQSMRAEYGAMIASIGGGQGGQYSFQSAKDAIPLGYTSEQYQGVQDNLNLISQKNIESAKNTIGGLSGGLPQLGTGGDKVNNTPTVVAPTDIPSGYYQASDGLLYKK